MNLRTVLAVALWWGVSSAQAQVTPSGCEPLPGNPIYYNVGFDEIYTEILEQRCNGCHIGDDLGGFNIDYKFAYANLINIGSSTGAGMVRVRPGNPEMSFLWLKLNCDNPGRGTRMPFNGPPYLSPAQQAKIYDWIALGAPLFPDEERVFAGRFEARY